MRKKSLEICHSNHTCKLWPLIHSQGSLLPKISPDNFYDHTINSVRPFQRKRGTAICYRIKIADTKTADELHYKMLPLSANNLNSTFVTARFINLPTDILFLKLVRMSSHWPTWILQISPSSPTSTWLTGVFENPTIYMQRLRKMKYKN